MTKQRGLIFLAIGAISLGIGVWALIPRHWYDSDSRVSVMRSRTLERSVLPVALEVSIPFRSLGASDSNDEIAARMSPDDRFVLKILRDVNLDDTRGNELLTVLMREGALAPDVKDAKGSEAVKG